MNNKKLLFYVFNIKDNIELLDENIYNIHLKYLKYYYNIWDECIFIILSENINDKLINDIKIKLSCIFYNKNIQIITEETNNFNETYYYKKYILNNIFNYKNYYIMFGNTFGISNKQDEFIRNYYYINDDNIEKYIKFSYCLNCDQSYYLYYNYNLDFYLKDNIIFGNPFFIQKNEQNALKFDYMFSLTNFYWINVNNIINNLSKTDIDNIINQNETFNKYENLISFFDYLKLRKRPLAQILFNLCFINILSYYDYNYFINEISKIDSTNL